MRSAEILSIGDAITVGFYTPVGCYRRAMNYSCGSQFLALVHESLGAGPDRIVIADDAWECVRAKKPPISVTRQHVQIAERRCLRGLIPLYRSRIPRARRCHGWISALENLLRREAPAESLVFLLAPRRHDDGTFERAFREYMSKEVDTLMRCLIAGLRSESVRKRAVFAAQRIAGAGRGLTPSGDDFLAGMLLAFRVWAAPALVAAWRRIVGDACRSTQRLSAHFLKLAAAGRSPEALRQMIIAMRSGNSVAMVREARRVLDWGATSGADLLVGFTLAGKALLGSDVKE